MTTYLEARSARQTQAQHRAGERAKREMNKRLLEELKPDLSRRKLARIRKALL
jgi:hypothetical protein